MSAPTHVAEQARRPAGSPSGGRFAAAPRTESGLDLTGFDPHTPASVPHPVAWLPAGQARPRDLMSVVRAGLPDHENGVPAVLTRQQVREVLTRHLPGLYRDDLAAHLAEIESAAARLDEMEATDPDGLDPDLVDPDTAYPISLDRVREDYQSEVEAVAAWRDELRDWWAAYTQAAIHTAWTHSLGDRAPSAKAAAR